MTGALLASGTLTEFEPLGAGGQTLFGLAAELREAIRKPLGEDSAACLAVLQQNADGDTLDWYAPKPGPVTPWADLSDAQRAAVLERVEALRGKVLDLSRKLVREDRRDRQTFGRLLEHAATIPDEDRIFLVGGQPVLTFWGFRRRGSDSITEVPEGARRLTRPRVDDPKPRNSAPAAPKRPSTALRRWGLPVAVLILTLLIAGILWRAMIPPPGTPGTSAPILPTATAEPPPEPLVFPAETIRTGSLGFLTGRWQARGEDLIDSATRRPISLAYDLDQGSGEVAVIEQSGTVCRAPVDAAFNGETLTLTPRGEIRCPDHAPFFGATVTCRPSTDRRARCTGSFPDGKVFHVELGRQQ